MAAATWGTVPYSHCCRVISHAKVICEDDDGVQACVGGPHMPTRRKQTHTHVGMQEPRNRALNIASQRRAIQVRRTGIQEQREPKESGQNWPRFLTPLLCWCCKLPIRPSSWDTKSSVRSSARPSSWDTKSSVRSPARPPTWAAGCCCGGRGGNVRLRSSSVRSPARPPCCAAGCCCSGRGGNIRLRSSAADQERTQNFQHRKERRANPQERRLHFLGGHAPGVPRGREGLSPRSPAGPAAPRARVLREAASDDSPDASYEGTFLLPRSRSRSPIPNASLAKEPGRAIHRTPSLLPGRPSPFPKNRGGWNRGEVVFEYGRELRERERDWGRGEGRGGAASKTSHI
jgi:hypothetical protein